MVIFMVDIFLCVDREKYMGRKASMTLELPKDVKMKYIIGTLFYS